MHVGIGCSYHTDYEIVTVVNFAAALQENANPKERRATDSPANTNIINPKKVSQGPSRSSGDRADTKYAMSKQSEIKDVIAVVDEDDGESDSEWPEGAVGMKEEKFENVKGNKKIVRVKRKYKMENGTVLIKEFSTVERLS